MQLQQELDRFEDVDADIYGISVDSPGHHEEFKEAAGITYSFLSDPNQEVIEIVEMSDGDISYRGFSILDENGEKIYSHVNDLFGEQIDDTEERIREALNE